MSIYCFYIITYLRASGRESASWVRITRRKLTWQFAKVMFTIKVRLLLQHFRKYITEVGTVADVAFYVYSLQQRRDHHPNLSKKERKLTSRDIEPKTTKATNATIPTKTNSPVEKGYQS
ncbi:MAG: hypothetical protein OEZ31_10595 [Nitrospirota bacterium]|nr:hypothetical protein [Nitrospirota bacterium]MDH5769386.1 hypothetical protein [Nitrospirota bacterium]